MHEYQKGKLVIGVFQMKNMIEIDLDSLTITDLEN